MFKGSMVAIVTPFKATGEIDEAAFERLIEFQLGNGTQAIVPCGTTGESATLSHAEHERVIKLAIEIVNKRVPVIAGTGSNSTAEALRLTKNAKAAGADGALVITPYYNKPSQTGLYEHFKQLAQVADIPIVLYNVPGRTGINMLPSTVARLAELDNIVAIKEASGSLTQMTEILSLCGEKITLLSGDDFIILPVLAIGGQGVISVAANIVPDRVAGLVNTFEAGNLKEAARIQIELFPLCQAMFYETNPMPVKTALSLMGKIEGSLRSPLCAMSPQNLDRLKDTLNRYGLI
jgi:4-hydroxy-tetrahydrodipicolinate synthase